MTLSRTSADRADDDGAILARLFAQKEIEAVLADYAIGLDDSDTDRFISAFHDDAVLEAAAGRVEGRAAILKWAEQVFHHRTMAHLTGNHRIEIIDERAATGVGSGYALSSQEDGTVVLAFGRLTDRYSMVNGKWRISYRNIHVMSAFKLGDTTALIINGAPLNS